MATISEPPVDVPVIRGKLAQYRIPIFVLSARIGVHPRRVGEMLNGRRPLPPELAAKILQAIEQG